MLHASVPSKSETVLGGSRARPPRVLDKTQLFFLSRSFSTFFTVVDYQSLPRAAKTSDDLLVLFWKNPQLSKMNAVLVMFSHLRISLLSSRVTFWDNILLRGLLQPNVTDEESQREVR